MQEGVVRQTWVVTVMVLAVGLVLPFVGGVAARQGDTVAAVKQQFAGNYELVRSSDHRWHRSGWVRDSCATTSSQKTSSTCR